MLRDVNKISVDGESANLAPCQVAAYIDNRGVLIPEQAGIWNGNLHQCEPTGAPLPPPRLPPIKEGTPPVILPPVYPPFPLPITGNIGGGIITNFISQNPMLALGGAALLFYLFTKK